MWAFSLVEVVLAMGIATFCLIVLLGLLPIGLKSAKNSREQTAAASLMEEISSNIRNATSTNWGTAALTNTALGICTNLVWTPGASAITKMYTNSLGGTVGATTPRLLAVVILNPQPNLAAPVTAQVSVAWPSQATWTPATKSWSNAAGSVDSFITVMPRQ